MTAKKMPADKTAEKPLNAESVARSLKNLHAKAGKHEATGQGFSFDFGKLLQAYKVITQLIPLVKDLIAIVKQAASGTTPTTEQVAAVTDRAASLGIGTD